MKRRTYEGQSEENVAKALERRISDFSITGDNTAMHITKKHTSSHRRTMRLERKRPMFSLVTYLPIACN